MNPSDVRQSWSSLLAQRFGIRLIVAGLLIVLGMFLWIAGVGKNEALIRAATDGKLEYVRELLEKGAEVNAREKNGLTALKAASGRGHLEIVKLLLEKGADLNAEDKGFSLRAAAWTGRLELAKLMLDKGGRCK